MKMKYIVVTLAIQREGDYYVSRCQELGTASFGATKEEALQKIVDATELYLNTLEDLGECERVLREKGVQVHADEPATRKVPPRSRNSSLYIQVMPLGYACA